jgi:hypothetical protein
VIGDCGDGADYVDNEIPGVGGIAGLLFSRNGMNGSSKKPTMAALRRPFCSG